MNEPILFESVHVSWTEWEVTVTMVTGDRRAVEAIFNALRAVEEEADPDRPQKIAVTFSKPGGTR
jgi:hypothetical protein